MNQEKFSSVTESIEHGIWKFHDVRFGAEQWCLELTLEEWAQIQKFDENDARNT